MLSKIYLSFLFLIYLLSLIVYIGFGVSAKQTWILVHTLQKHNLCFFRSALTAARLGENRQEQTCLQWSATGVE